MGTTSHHHDIIGNKQDETREWGFFDPGFNCKMKISAGGKLNAKIIVVIKEVKNTNLIIYEMPNSFSESYGTHGILENNRIYTDVKSGKHMAPSDWSIWLVFNPKFGGGYVKFEHWVDNYDESDVNSLNGEW